MLSAVSAMGDTCSVRTPSLVCGAAFLPLACERRWLGLFQCTWLSRLSDNLAKPVGGVSEAGWLCGLQKLVRNINTGNYNRNWPSDRQSLWPWVQLGAARRGFTSGVSSESILIPRNSFPVGLLKTRFL